MHWEYFETDVSIGCVGTDCIRCVHAVLPRCRDQLRPRGSVFVAFQRY